MKLKDFKDLFLLLLLFNLGMFIGYTSSLFIVITINIFFTLGFLSTRL